MKNKYFVTADVCGYLRMWSGDSKEPKLIDTLYAGGAISYNCVVELKDFLPLKTSFIAVAVKSGQLIKIMVKQTGFQIVFSLNLGEKPTCI